MNIPHLSFSLAEKLAIVNAIDALILVDGNVHNGEINVLTKLMKSIDFDSNFIVQARNIATDQCVLILNQMPKEKKDNLTQILQEVAISDGFCHEKETALIESIFH
jgi:uncharacterized tellurite resistance protein B-like protein